MIRSRTMHFDRCEIGRSNHLRWLCVRAERHRRFTGCSHLDHEREEFGPRSTTVFYYYTTMFFNKSLSCHRRCFPLHAYRCGEHTYIPVVGGVTFMRALFLSIMRRVVVPSERSNVIATEYCGFRCFSYPKSSPWIAKRRYYWAI